jgi:hypothetical protein
MARFWMALVVAYATVVGALAAGMVASREGAQFDHRRSRYRVAGIVLLAAALVLTIVAASMAEVGVMA